MEEVRWGIIGCGKVTEIKSGPALAKIPGSKLIAVMRRDGDKAKDYARRHGVSKWYDNADELLQDPDVNAIYVATPPDSHADYTVQAAKLGKPVYVEKPMARNHAECRTMIEACRSAGVPLFVAYYRRALPAFLRVKELVESGAIGDVRIANIRLFYPVREQDRATEKPPWRLVPEISGGGYFFDLGSHQLDFLDFLLGPIDSVQGQAMNQAGLYTAEDAVSASYRFAAGVVGAGTWCFTAASNQTVDETELIGSKGRIAFSSFAMDAPVRLETDAGHQELASVPPEHVQQPLIQTVVDALLGYGACASTGESAARTAWVMDQILAGFRAAP